MLFLLRNIRRKLLSSENKTISYILYAIGEIFLVVVGILIAVQIDDWSEDRNNRKKEIQILKDLNSEFLKNKEKLNSTIRTNQSSLEAIETCLRLMGESDAVLERYNLDSLLFLTIEYDDINPSQSVILELISSGKMNLIKSDTIRMLIFEWVSAIDEETESYSTLDQVSQSLLLPYITKYGSMKNMDSYGILSKNGKSKFESRNQVLFHQIEFENNLDNQAWGVTNYLKKLHNLEKILEAIINNTDQSKK